jgi:hypothetical protein
VPGDINTILLAEVAMVETVTEGDGIVVTAEAGANEMEAGEEEEVCAVVEAEEKAEAVVGRTFNAMHGVGVATIDCVQYKKRLMGVAKLPTVPLLDQLRSKIVYENTLG